VGVAFAPPGNFLAPATPAIAAIITPAIRDHDSFPLSTYPMYAFTRERVDVLATAVGVDGAGQMRRLSLGARGSYLSNDCD
jgi:hypothetical protein